MKILHILNENVSDVELDKLFGNLQRIGDYTMEDIYEIISEEFANKFTDDEVDSGAFDEWMDYAIDKYTKDTGHTPK